MKNQVLVIGLGQFGLGLVRALSRSHADIIAVDLDQKRVDLAASWVSKAVCMDATDEELLTDLQPGKRDVCICATGDQSKEVGIICTALLKQFGAPRIIARANDDLHARILRLVGAHEVVNPEWDFGERFAPRILNEHVIDEMLLGADLAVSEFKVPEPLNGKTLSELNLLRKYNMTVVAIRRKESQSVQQAVPDDKVHLNDILIAVAKKGALEKFMGDFNR